MTRAHVVVVRASQNVTLLFQSSAIFTVTISVTSVTSLDRLRRLLGSG